LSNVDGSGQGKYSLKTSLAISRIYVIDNEENIPRNYFNDGRNRSDVAGEKNRQGLHSKNNNKTVSNSFFQDTECWLVNNI